MIQGWMRCMSSTRRGCARSASSGAVPTPSPPACRSRFPHRPDTGPGLTDAGRELVRACNSLGIMLDNSHLNEKGFWDVAALSDAPLVATHSCAHALCPDAAQPDRQAA